MMEREKEIEDRDSEIIENAEMESDDTYEKKDLKEKRGAIKEHFYRGSKKTKHVVQKKGQ